MDRDKHTATKKEKIEKQENKEKIHSIKLYKRNYFPKQVATGDLKQLHLKGMEQQ